MWVTCDVLFKKYTKKQKYITIVEMYFLLLYNWPCNRARRQSGFPTFISCQRQDTNVLPKRRQLHQGDKLCDVGTVPLVARWPVYLACGSDVDGKPHYTHHGWSLQSTELDKTNLWINLVNWWTHIHTGHKMRWTVAHNSYLQYSDSYFTVLQYSFKL